MGDKFFEHNVMERICDGSYIQFYNLNMCRTVRRFNGENADEERIFTNGFTGTMQKDRSYSEPDYMNLVDLAEQIMNVNGVEHVSFMPYRVRVFIATHFEESAIKEVCASIIDAWILTRSICKEEQ